MTVDDGKEFRCKMVYRGVECCGSKRTECEKGSIPEFALCVWVYLKPQRLQDTRFIIGSHLETKHKSLGVFLFSFVPIPWQHRLHPPEQHLNVSSCPAATNDWFAAAPFSLKKIFGSCLLMGLPFVNVCLRLLQMDLDMLLCTEWHIKVENYNLPL